MILPDVNVLVYAFRADAVQHKAYASWLNEVVNAESAYAMAPQVLGAFVRVVTNRRVFVRPSRLEDALAFATAVISPAHCQVIQPGPRHWAIFTGLCRSSKATGNLVADAWLAALAVESGCEWITTDRDFKRFHGLRTRAPF